MTVGGRAGLFRRLAGFLAVAVVVGFGIGALLPAGQTASALAVLVGSVAGGVAMLTLDGRPPAALGFHLSRQAPGEVGLGLLLGLGVSALAIGGMAVLGVVRWVPQAGSMGSWAVGAAAALVLFALPAAAEEALLRGYPLQALSAFWGGIPAVLATSLLFGFLHLSNPGVGWLSTVNVTAAGVLLGIVYLRTSSLWWPTGVHLGWNWSQGYGADVAVSGLDLVDAPMYEGVTSGPGWLGGGSFGPEGSVVTTVVLLGSSAACWWGPWLRPGRAAIAADPLNPKTEG